MFVGPQLRLPDGDSGAVEFDQTGLPFVYQLRGLTRTPLGAGQHPLHMDALLCRFVGLAGGMIWHTILTQTLADTGRDAQPDFIQAGSGAGRGACRCRQALG